MDGYFNNVDQIDYRILHIEDNPADVLLVHTYLRRVGLGTDHLKHVKTLEEGIRVLKENNKVEFVLLDLSLPDCQGIETFEKCVAAARTCPIVVLTGFSEQQTARGLLDRGAYAFLQKDEITEAVIFSTIYGVIKRKKYERDLQELRKKAEIADEEKTRFLGLISHELRTPLAAIIGFTELLLEDSNLHQSQLGTVSKIKSNSLHLKTLVNDLVDLSEIELGRIEIRRSKVDLSRLLDDTVESIRIQNLGKMNPVVVVSKSSLPTYFYSDATRLRQVLLNLLSNAVKFADDGRVELSVGVHNINAGEAELVFHITDDGTGIPQESIGRLFQPYGRVHMISEPRQGAGLGLALSRKLARALGGDVVLDYTSNAGTRFTVRVVVQVAETGWSFFNYNANETIHECRSLRGDEELKGTSILIIEDAKDLRELYKAVLLSRGAAEVEVAETGEAGLNAAIKKKFCCILLDLSLPDKDGFQVAEELLKNGVRSPIVALTAHVALKIKEKALQQGFADLLTKPVAFDALTRTIKLAQLASL